MDPFSITAGAIGITTFASTSILQLRTLINGLTEAGDVLEDISSTLDGIERPLAALDQLSLSDITTSSVAKEDLERAGVAEAVNKCGKACDALAKDIKRWTKHSSAARLSLRDRFSIGVLKKEKLCTYKTQIQSCQTTVQFAVNSVQL
jgi:hypothetical protein